MSICESEVMERGKVDWNDYNLAGDGSPAPKRTNLTCPECAEPCFVAVRSLKLPDGSTWRERHCRSCGHIEERIQPPERPVE